MSHGYRLFTAQRAKKVTGGATAMVVVAACLVVATPSAQAAKSYTVIAHRGDRDDAPENTIAALRLAIDKGADVVEFDVAYSSSGYAVVLHDATLNRTTNCSGRVSNRSRTQLKKCKTSNGEPVPTLRAALSAISERSGSVKVLLHMKVTPTAKLANRTMDDVKRYGMNNRTYVLASNAETFRQMKAKGAKRFAYIFNDSKGWDKDYEVMIPYETPLTKSGINRAHRRGNKVWPVENHPDSLKRMLDAGRVDGILADNLDRLLKMLSRSVSSQAAAEADAQATAPDNHHGSWADEVTRPR